MTYFATHLHKYFCPGVHEIYNFGRTFLGHHYYILSLSEPKIEKKIFYEIHQFKNLFPSYYPPPPSGWGFKI